jgi:hypothetical protein
MTAEDILRRALADDRRAVSPWPDPVTRVATGIRRRRRRRLAAVGAAGAVAVVLVAVSAAVTGRPVADPAPPGTSNDVVPWVNTPAVRPTAYARLSPQPATARPCTAADLSPRGGWVETDGDWSTRWIQTVVVRNEAETACTLVGSAAIRAGSADGRAAVPVTRVGPVEMEGAQYPATLTPLSSARIDVAMTCPSGPPSGAGALRDPAVEVAGGEIPVAALVVHRACTIEVGDWYWLRPLVNAPITATMTGPGQVTRGQSFTYEVTLLDAIGGGFALRPCPVYRQSLAGHTDWLRLNCAVSWLPANRPVRFEMRMRVPPDAALGPARLTWMGVTGDGQVIVAAMDTGGWKLEITEA